MEDKVTRLEVIDDDGRVYSCRRCRIDLSYQDDGRTLKVFVKRGCVHKFEMVGQRGPEVGVWRCEKCGEVVS